MAQRPNPPAPTRQWRLTLTEEPNSGVYTASIQWRQFPCRADDWAGRWSAQILSPGPRIGNPSDLEAVLILFTDADWSLSTADTLRNPPKQV